MKRIYRALNTPKLLAVFLFSFFLLGCKKGDRYADDSVWSLTFSQPAQPTLLQGDSQTFLCPILQQSEIWGAHIHDVSVIRRGNITYALYSASSDEGEIATPGRIGVALSGDGQSFSKIKQPILFPDEDFMKIYEWPGGVSDPKVYEGVDGTYIMTYLAHDGHTSRLCIASSADLLNWTKHGPAFTEPFVDFPVTSSSIITAALDDRLVAKKIGGRYWMYVGQSDLFAAISNDMIRWIPLSDEEDETELISVMKPRQDYFDDQPLLAGPALFTDAGILLLYNSSSVNMLPGQALLDPLNPTEVVDRLPSNFLEISESSGIKVESLFQNKDQRKLYVSSNSGIRTFNQKP